jgi:hypothetical protein
MRALLFSGFCGAIVGVNALVARLVGISWSENAEFAILVGADVLLAIGSWELSGELARKIDARGDET